MCFCDTEILTKLCFSAPLEVKCKSHLTRSILLWLSFNYQEWVGLWYVPNWGFVVTLWGSRLPRLDSCQQISGCRCGCSCVDLYSLHSCSQRHRESLWWHGVHLHCRFYLSLWKGMWPRMGRRNWDWNESVSRSGKCPSHHLYSSVQIAFSCSLLILCHTCIWGTL